jgi:hypothetical protein
MCDMNTSYDDEPKFKDTGMQYSEESDHDNVTDILGTVDDCLNESKVSYQETATQMDEDLDFSERMQSPDFGSPEDVSNIAAIAG